MEKSNLKSLLLDLDPEEEGLVILETVEELSDKIDEFRDNIDEIKKEVGPKGDRGLPGNDGKNGKDGKDGEDGKDGKNGRDGKQGLKGDKGDDGKDGESVKLKDVVDKIQPEVFRRLPQGGGNMNRQVKFNATDYLTKYTDINWKAGTNVTFTIANNDQTKMVDVTVAASGGGGGGMVRSINSISGDTTAGATAGTDYVYLCTGTLTLTLPTAAGNTNLYTVKNVGTGVVTINTTGAETIDGDLTKTMNVQFTSVDLISDTVNWNVT